MHALIKTTLIAAIGTAVVAASPALAKTRRADPATPVYGMAYGYELTPGVVQFGSHGPLFASPANWGDPQIRGNYIKDDSSHNGNAY